MAERKKVKKVSLNKTSSPKKIQTKKVASKPPKKEKTVALKPNKKVTENKTEKIVMKNENENSVKKPVNGKGVPSKTVPKRSGKERTYVRPRQTERKKTGINWSILMGKKKEAQRKRLATLFVAFPLVLALLLFVFLTPTGPIEAITNSFAVIGAGKFPKSISGDTALSLKTEKNNAFVLTNTHIMGYTSAGKELYEHQHNFSSPVLETSSTRALIFNRGSTGYTVLNNSGTVFEKELDRAIMCADISENGNIAFATESKKYSAQVDVYSRRMKHRFSWYTVSGLISDIALSKNGKFVAVAVLKAKNGNFESEIHCFNTKSGKTLFTTNIEGTPIFQIENISNRYFSYTTKKGVCFVNWRNGEEKRFEETDLAPTFFKKYKNYSLAVFGENTSSTIKVIDKVGKEKAKLVYNGLIDDAVICNKNIYLLKGSKIFVLNFQGEIINTLSTEQTQNFLSATQKGIFVSDNLNLSFLKG